MKIYNSLTKQIEELTPLRSGQIGLYTCGPTVYDHVHIGNLRTYVFEDTLRRALKADDYEVKHVMNITDVDDKTIARSHRQHPNDEAKIALGKLTRHYERLFMTDAKKIGIDLTQSIIARATEHIDDMKLLIDQIPNKYVGDDGVYYDIAKDNQYGVLVKLDRGHAHHRINNDEYDKDHVADFALWKKQTADEPAWEFEIDGQAMRGRPGWHIECSAMSVKYLGQPFDIHTGGTDLKFPHHENEIAQNRAASSSSLANYFMHAEHLLVDGHKMSKKLNNFYTLKDVENHGFDPLALRLLFMQAHYRSQLSFTWESLEAAAVNLIAIRNWADLIHQAEIVKNDKEPTKQLKTIISKALSNDLNTPEAIAVLNNPVSSQRPPTSSLLVYLDQMFGLQLAGRPDITAEQKQLIVDREDARQKQDWQEADRLRNQLQNQAIEINDTTGGPIWSRS